MNFLLSRRILDPRCDAQSSANPAVWLAVLVSLTLAGCGTPRKPAPVEDRPPVVKGSAPAFPKPNASPTPEVRAHAEAPETSGKQHIVRRGETLRGIALLNGVTVKDLIAWNSISNPNVIEVGQVLRLAPVAALGASPKDIQPPADGVVQTSPIAPPGSGPVRPLDAPVSPAAGKGGGKPPEGATESEGVVWAWPINGKVITEFADSTLKGISISGAEGDPIYAAADGRVIYSGNGLRGYGNLVIVKHAGEWLSVYAHNKQLLVRSGQEVKRGERIAELGRSDTDQPKLHFEIRKQSKPVDPRRYLPAER